MKFANALDYVKTLPINEQEDLARSAGFAPDGFGWVYSRGPTRFALEQAAAFAYAGIEPPSTRGGSRPERKKDAAPESNAPAPARALKVCSVPGCPNLTARGQCDTHRRQATRRRTEKRRERGGSGSDPGWERTRKRVLARDPFCRCDDREHDLHKGSICTRRSEHVDHVVPKYILLRRGDRRPNRLENLQGLCARCHAHKTALEEGAAERLRGGG